MDARRDAYDYSSPMLLSAENRNERRTPSDERRGGEKLK